MQRPFAFLRVAVCGFFLVFAKASHTENTKPELLNTPLIQKVQEDCLELAREVERAHSAEQRCDTSILRQCDRSNYDQCNSVFPNLTCEKADLELPICSNSGPCTTNGFDESVSVIRIPPFVPIDADGNPDSSDTQVIETICYTQQLDPWFSRKRREDLDFYSGYDIDPPQMFYGARNGVFRLYPAQHADTCHTYDPTTRDWYVAGSSGPKNIVLVLDTSGSMARDCEACLASMQKAAKRIVNSLTIGDFVAIVTFNSEATLYADPETGFLYRATRGNREKLIEAIDGLTAIGGTNFYDPLEMAFDALDETIKSEIANCNSAVIFLTDGRVSSGGDDVVGNITGLTAEEITLRREEAVLDLVERRLATSRGESQVHGTTTNQVLFFAYSIGGYDSELHAFPKRLACESTELGVWSKIVQPNDIVESLSSYYLLFSLGLADGKNTNFTTWVEPYKYAGTGILGTTISSPVFDRSYDPPIFLGVVGVDLPVTAIDRALGVSAGSSLSSEEIFAAASFKCPVLELPPCLMESFRKVSGAASVCGKSNCTGSDFVPVETELCPHETDYTEHPLVPTTLQGVTEVDKFCCSIQSDGCFEGSSRHEPSESPDRSIPSDDETGKVNVGSIVGGVAGGVLALMAAAVACHLSRTMEPRRGANDSANETDVSGNDESQPRPQVVEEQPLSPEEMAGSDPTKEDVDGPKEVPPEPLSSPKVPATKKEIAKDNNVSQLFSDGQ